MITAFYVAYTLTQYAWTNAHDNALFALMEQTAGAWEYGGRGSSKPGANALFTQIVRVPLDLNNEDEGEKLMKHKGCSTEAWIVQKYVAQLSIASNKHLHNNENGWECCFFHQMALSENSALYNESSAHGLECLRTVGSKRTRTSFCALGSW